MGSPLPPFIKYDNNNILIDYTNIEQRKNTTIFTVKKSKSWNYFSYFCKC